MVTRGTATRNSNGRTKAENQAYAKIGRAGLTRQQEVTAAATARAGRRAKAAERIIARDGKLEPDVLERRIDAEIANQMTRARAAALTARRRAREAADRLAAAEAELAAVADENLGLSAEGLEDSGSDGIDADS